MSTATTAGRSTAASTSAKRGMIRSRASPPSERTNATIQPPGQPSTPASQMSLSLIAAYAGTALATSLRCDHRRSIMAFRPRRSVLYMPGSNARALEKAKTLAADGVILDLEDSVAPDAKEAARQQVADAVKAGGFGRREVFIRVNGVDTPWHADDLAAAAHAAPDIILVPKVSGPDTLEMIGRRLLDMGTAHKTRVWAMIETPLAIFNILAIAAAARDSETRLG